MQCVGLGKYSGYGFWIENIDDHETLISYAPSTIAGSTPLNLASRVFPYFLLTNWTLAVSINCVLQKWVILITVLVAPFLSSTQSHQTSLILSIIWRDSPVYWPLKVVITLVRFTHSYSHTLMEKTAKQGANCSSGPILGFSIFSDQCSTLGKILADAPLQFHNQFIHSHRNWMYVLKILFILSQQYHTKLKLKNKRVLNWSSVN